MVVELLLLLLLSGKGNAVKDVAIGVFFQPDGVIEPRALFRWGWGNVKYVIRLLRFVTSREQSLSCSSERAVVAKVLRFHSRVGIATAYTRNRYD
jgi:hypothetical protein